MSGTKEYDDLLPHEKDLVQIGYEVGYERAWVERAKFDGVLILTRTEELAFSRVLKRKLKERNAGTE